MSPSRPASWSLRAAACALCMAAVLALACGSVPAAMAAGTLGGGSSFNELTEEGQTEATTTSTTSTGETKSATEPSNSKRTILLALGAAVLLLSGIAFVIVRDARKVAPAGDSDLLEGRSARDQAAQLRKRRAKAKAARRQRKRNR
ncbi:MAG: hypothetical protein ACLQQB_07030 [Solirubrobacteraceae bacterium]